ncbi:MAG: hypothetical protein R2706_03510 [Acidimicrobiales bacterium]
MSPSIAVVGSGCDIDVSLTDTEWDDVISSTTAVCPVVEHWETSLADITDAWVFSGTDEIVEAGGRTPVGTLDNITSGLRYSDALVDVDSFVYVA